MEGIKEWIQITISVITLAGVIIAMYKFSNDPDNRADKQIGINEASCVEKHKRVDEILEETKSNFIEIKSDIRLIKENDLKHIEQEMRKISQQQTKILTILEYRDNIKNT